jgi:hypothetical protein
VGAIDDAHKLRDMVVMVEQILDVVGSLESTYSFIRAMGATLEALIAAFCRLDKSLSCCWEKGWLVGAVGIERTSY